MPVTSASSLVSNLNEREEFRTNSSVKPPYSYSQLIILAMKESTCAKMTLQMIYDWIIENFSYFKKADPSWQVTFKNSIRHNLSLNKCFRKIARQKDEPCKGGFWTLEPDYEKQVGEGGGPKAAEAGEAELEKKEGMGAIKRRRVGCKATKTGQDKANGSGKDSGEFKVRSFSMVNSKCFSMYFAKSIILV